jgi:hypothetical protein
MPCGTRTIPKPLAIINRSMIKKYRKETLREILLVALISALIISLDLFNDEALWWNLLVVEVGRIFYIIFFKLLLVDIKIEEGEIRVKYYSIAFKGETLVISNDELIDLESKKPNSIVFIINGTNGPIKKPFYSKSPPWGPLNLKLIEINKTIANNK